MEAAFVKRDPAELKENPFDTIGNGWMLITAKDNSGFNTMTANWGMMGFLWKKNVVTCFVRKHRHTYAFMENAAHFTLSFFDEAYRPALQLCGAKSGRDCNKVAEAGLTPVDGPGDTVYFNEARLVLVAKKLYRAEMTGDGILDPAVDILYPAMDYHVVYVGEIQECLEKA